MISSRDAPSGRLYEIVLKEIPMSVDLAQAVGHKFDPVEISYSEKDVSLYGLSIGAASDPIDV